MSVEERVRAATHARADLVRDIPPLALPDELSRPLPIHNRNRRRVAWAAPLAAAAVVLALVASQLWIRSAVGPDAAGTGAGPATSAAAATPRYWAALDGGNAQVQLVVGEVGGGRVLAAVHRRGFQYVGVAGGAADDRTFVAAIFDSKTTLTSFQKVTVSGTRVRISPLPIQPFTMKDQPAQLALSADGTELALLNTNVGAGQLWVYSVADGRLLGHWTQHTPKGSLVQVSDLGPFTGSRVTFANYSKTGAGQTVYQLRELNVRAPSGDLMAAGKLQLQFPASVRQAGASVSPCGSWMITSDGGSLVCGTTVSSGSAKLVASGLSPNFTQYPLRAGKRSALLYGYHGSKFSYGAAEVLWAGPEAGPVLVELVLVTPARKYQYTFGLVSGGRFTPLPHPGAKWQDLISLTF